MADFPNNGACPAVISSFSRYSAGAVLVDAVASGGASSLWPAANRACYIPFWLPAPFTVKSMFAYNGTAVAGNIDLGVATPDGSLIVNTGSTAQAGTSQLQIITCTATYLPPGQYLMALSASSASATFFMSSVGIATQQAIGILQAATAVPLPAAPTLATSVAGVFTPFIGLASITTY